MLGGGGGAGVGDSLLMFLALRATNSSIFVLFFFSLRSPLI